MNQLQLPTSYQPLLVQLDICRIHPRLLVQLTLPGQPLAYIASSLTILNRYLQHHNTLDLLAASIEYNNLELFSILYENYFAALNPRLEVMRAVRRSVAQWGRLEMMQRMLQQGNPQSGWLTVCAHQGQLDMIRFLLDQGVDLNEADGAPLIDSIENGHDAVAECLVERGADLSIDNYQAAHSAVRLQKYKLLRLMTQRGLPAHLISPEERGE